MDEFTSRMDAQRRVLEVVNHQTGFVEELCGLSKKAIERWLSVNHIPSSSELAVILFEISSKLFFLASKSQEQVTERYKLLSKEIHRLQKRLETQLTDPKYELTRQHGEGKSTAC